MSSIPSFVYVVVPCVILFIIILCVGYLKAPPNEAYIISGLGKMRILIGKAGIRIPFFERVNKIKLEVVQVEVCTSKPVPTVEFINVDVESVASVKVSSTPALLFLACESLLNKDQEELKRMITNVLETNIREIIGSTELTKLITDRQSIVEKIKTNAFPDMEKFGLEILNFNIQNISDQNGTIENLGVNNVEQIRKGSLIAMAEAARDVEIAQSQAKQLSNVARVEAEKKIAEQNAELSIKQFEMQKQADIKKAEQDSAYGIQEQEQRKAIEISTQNAEIAKREKMIELAGKEIEVQEKKLDAEVNQKAIAERFKIEQEADANLYRRTKDAEAKMKEAESLKYSMEQEAKGIEAKGIAEGVAIEKKAEAMAKMNQAAVLDMYFKVLPEIVKNAAEPLTKVDSITMYGDGNASNLVGDIMRTTNQVFEGIQGSTGIDLTTFFNKEKVVESPKTNPVKEDIPESYLEVPKKKKATTEDTII